VALEDGDIHLRYSLSVASGVPAAMFLHGFLGCRHDWDEVVDVLGDQYRHLRVDLPGHSSSFGDLPTDACTIAGCSRLMIDLLDNCEIERCHLVGYSMGGRLGLYLLTYNSERFQSGVIESASPGLKTEPERAERIKQDQRWVEQLRERPYEEFLRDWYAQPLFGRVDQTTERFEKMLWRRRQRDPKALAVVMEQMGTGRMPPLWEKLPEIKVPVLFVAGERDKKYCSLVGEMADLCPRGETAIIAAAGHNTHFERPEVFAEKVSQFLKQIS
jgi:2-succinyl-6-hydroxy-2,4-cyclohexadiene-1-carboxylate synthase